MKTEQLDIYSKCNENYLHTRELSTKIRFSTVNSVNCIRLKKGIKIKTTLGRVKIILLFCIVEYSIFIHQNKDEYYEKK